MKEELKRIADKCAYECAYYYECFLKGIIAFLVIITSPIWIVPYELYWHLKNKKGGDKE